MKKILFILTLLAVFLLPGASIWEGAAAVSTDFPEKGLYVATNSFPRNTIVDLTNLETGKTVRVIVSAGLDAPGLLALVSREVAEEVGLQSRTIGRIRMTQPSDPIAFSRFTEDYLNSGDPDHDPAAAVNGAYPDAISDPAVSGLPGEGPAGASAVPTAPDTPAAPAVSTVPAAPTAPAVPVVPPAAPVTPVTPAASSGGSSVPEDSAAGAKPGPSRESERDPEEAWLTGPVRPAGTEPEIPAADIPETTDAVALAAVTAPEPVIEEVPEEAVEPSVPQVPPPLISGPVIVPVPVPVPVPAQPAPAVQPDPAVQSEPPSGASGGQAPGYNYTLIPAEERPPEGSGPGSVPQIFSVPAVADLEHGKYYLQIGAYSKTEIVEKELARVDGSYPLAVQCADSAGRPVYRILIGPVNQGESGALLRNFRGRGYRDAFIRRGN